jgi:hypothetical protein
MDTPGSKIDPWLEKAISSLEFKFKYSLLKPYKIMTFASAMR